MSDEVFRHQLQSFGPLQSEAPRPAVVRWLQERPERIPRLQAWLQDHLRSQGPSGIGYGGYGVGFQGDHLYGHKGAYLVSLFYELAAAEPEQAMRRVRALLPSVPKNGTKVAEGLWDAVRWARPDDPGWTDLWEAILANRVPFRSVAVRQLRQQGRLTLEQAAQGLADSGIRKACLELLLEHPEDAQALARPLTKHRSRATREAALEVVRRVDPTFGMDEVTATDGDADAEVLADALTEQGDPRGQLIALTRAIEEAEPARALELSDVLAAHVEDHRGELWGRPGGWPTRERYRGRQYLELPAGWTFRGPKNRGERLLGRMEQFLRRFACDVVPIHSMYPTWSFCWAHPDTGIALPFQEGGHYAGEAPLDSSLTVHPDSGFVYARFALPFEQRTPAFATYVGLLEKELGRKLLHSREWSVMSPKAAGEGMVSRRGYLAEVP